ncbi:MAG: 30S ribosomal protein S20 [Bacteroidetes bacterium 4572_114]|nr:MAG: 30S ribosomal protein S20 [Bacteroidetes bacterium 4572_114]
MANHKSALKRIRSSRTRQLRNRYFARTMRNAIKEYRGLEDKGKATEQLPIIVALIDKNAKRNVIHKNKAANLKSKLTKQLNAMA